MIDLPKFCAGPGVYSDRIGKPFSRGDWTYATDGHIMIRVPRRTDVDEFVEAPDAERIWPTIEVTDFRQPVEMRFPAEETVGCDICGGRGYEHECPACTCVCGECDGLGELVVATAAQVGPRAINTKYAKMILSLPWPFIAEPSAGSVLLRFKFDGGEGIVTTMDAEVCKLPIVGKL